jgi:pyruvate/2-oxoglutarate dehydrogenase complex dihydrolipoamide dehydrogenase (E3) component
MATYDAIIVGTGQAGPALTRRLAGSGMKVAIIERGRFGGTCVNTGCTPTKTLVAYAAHVARRGAEYGFSAGEVKVDMKRVKARKDEFVGRSTRGVERSLKSLENCRVYEGPARLKSAREVEVGTEILDADRIFLNVGARASVPTIPGLHQIDYLTNSSMMDVDFLPPHLVVLGGSYLGLEFGQMYRRFGSEVTVIELGPRVTAREDVDVSEAITGFLSKEGITVQTNAKCLNVAKQGSDIVLTVDCDGTSEVRGTHLLVATGRRLNTDDLGLDRAGVQCDSHGYITVDALYTDPPLGRVGMTEAEVRKSGRRVLVGKLAMENVSRAWEKGETEGFMKMFVDADSKEILGASFLGTGGDEVIHCVLGVMYAKAPYTIIERAMHIHPTVAEFIPSLLQDLAPLPAAPGNGMNR